MQVPALSLLWPENRSVYADRTRKLGGAAIDNLELPALAARMAPGRERSESVLEMLTELCADEDVIAYRQEVIDDLLASPGLVDRLREVTEHLENLSLLAREASANEDASLWRCFSRLKELDAYAGCVTGIRQALANAGFRSRGLLRLQAEVTRTTEDPSFRELQETIRSLDVELGEIQSISLGLNLDSSLNPVEATLVSVNKFRYRAAPGLLGAIRSAGSRTPRLSTGEEDGEPAPMSRLHPVGNDRRDPIMYHLYKDIENILRPVVRDLHAGLRRYARLSARPLLGLIPELVFYLGCADLAAGMRAAGLPLCRPAIAPADERVCVIRDAYNIHLALHMLEQGDALPSGMVFNDIRFDDGGRIQILTGPNRGGKTVYTAAVGLAQVLFQAGMHVPGSEARMSPVDTVYTHFPVDESRTVELGRLGEEASRLHAIFDEATPHSLVLLNESLASTNLTEAVYIAQDVVKSLRFLGARVVYNTHMHDLAACAEAINREVPGDSAVISLVTGMADGRRSYRIQPGAPMGKSYARDIAMKFGICFEQVVHGLEARRTPDFPCA
ncbi:MAG: hypothetical protein KBA30_10635 [Clostridia bacterium]|nr:hypothetical protein [Clostridia bacterium]